MTNNFEVVQSYRGSNLDALTTPEIFMRGLHGVVVHIRRASIMPADIEKQPLRLKHLAAADQLITFLVGMADDRTEFGSVLIQCYTEIQNRVSLAIQTINEDPEQAINGALEEALALENNIQTTLNEGEHG